MPTTRTEARAISLDLELQSIEQALTGSRLLLDDLHVENEHARSALSGSIAVLALVIARVKLVRAAIREEVEPAHLVGYENTLPARVASHEDPDVRLPFGAPRAATERPSTPRRKGAR